MRINFYILMAMALMSGCSGARKFLCAWGERDQLLPDRTTGGYLVMRGQSYESCMGDEKK